MEIDVISSTFRFGFCAWNGKIAAVTNGSGLVTAYAYDVMDRVTNIVWTAADGTSLGGFAYAYDAIGRIVSRNHSLGTNAFSRAYTYDDFDRLATDGDTAYTYDAAGNRLTKSDSQGTTTYTRGAGDRLSSWTGGSYTHDTAGCVTRIMRGSDTLGLTWNGQYQLVSVATNGAFAESYAYDALGRRVSTTTLEGTIRHVYDGVQCIADLDADGEVVVSYTWGEGIDNLLAVHVNGSTYYPLTDVQGTVWGYVDASNNIVASFTYDAWGNILSATSSVPALARNRYRFQCREWSAATGLVNFRARWYDPATGRWLSKDPIGLGGGLNLYAFCGNDPVNSLDPYGEVGALIPIAAPVIVAGAIVGGAYVGAANMPKLVDEFTHMSKKLIDIVADFMPKGGHSKNVRPSSREKHQKGDARRKRDQERSRRRKNGGNRSIPFSIGDKDDDEGKCDVQN